MDFESIEKKEPHNIIPIYRQHLLEVDSPGFLDHYQDLIFERGFSRMFDYHVNLFKNEIYDRIRKAIPEFPIKNYSLQHLCQEILIENIDDKDMSKNLKYHLYAFDRSYNLVVKKIKNRMKEIDEMSLFSDDIITTNTKILKRLMLDVQDILPYFEAVSGLKLMGQVVFSRHISGEDISWFTQLFLNGILDCSNQAYFTTIAFLIRQGIEIRIKNALGIYSIDLNEKPVKIPTDVFINFIIKNPHIQFPSISKGILNSIFRWCNAHIHIGVSSFSWQTLVINEYINPLFLSGETEDQMSIHGSIRIERSYYFGELSKDIIGFLKDNKIQVDSVRLREKPEAMLV